MLLRNHPDMLGHNLIYMNSRRYKIVYTLIYYDLPLVISPLAQLD